MRILTCHLENFASYQNLDFSFTDQGLTLVHGATGSGKSTLCDAAPWVLFGKTAKNGAVDEVLSWPGNSVTKGVLTLEGGLTVTRTRGPKPKDNDLYFQTNNGALTRGKDLTDTQRLLNTALGMDCELYLSGAYFHEFSATAAFFTTTAKNRRAACEQIVDLSLAKDLQLKLTTSKKEVKAALNKARVDLEGAKARYEQTKKFMADCETKLLSWESKQAAKIAEAIELRDTFDARKNALISKLKKDEADYAKDSNKRRLEANESLARLDSCSDVLGDTEAAPCPTCGQSKLSTRLRQTNVREIEHYKALIKNLDRTPNPYTAQLLAETSRTNAYDKIVAGLEADPNPYIESLEEITPQLDQYKGLYINLTAKEYDYAQELGDIELMTDLVTTFRSSLVHNTIKSLEETTNALLAKHFDAEIQVTFDITEDVDVSITKDGNACVYTQLSKGQRQLLKLCFGVAVMQQVSNHQGIRFHQVFFDEALDGLGEIMKVKAFGLLKSLELEYESIFVVDHSLEIKPLFFNHYSVELVNGHSIIQEGS